MLSFIVLRNFPKDIIGIRKSNYLNLRNKTKVNSINTDKKQKNHTFFFSKIGSISRSHENRIQCFKILNLGFSFLGTSETIFLTVNKLNGSLGMCSTQKCSIVLDSVFSSVNGIPMSLLGALLYFSIFFFNYRNLIEFDSKKKYDNSILLVILTLQFVLCFFSFYFSLILKLFLQSNCPWCAFSMLISSLILFFGCISKNGNKILDLSKIVLLIVCGIFIIYLLFFLNILEILSDPF
jgi:uncharacterized membrane protein